MPKVEYVITADETGAVRGFRRVGEESESAGRKVQSAVGGIGSQLTALGSSLRSVGMNLSIALTTPTAALGAVGIGFSALKEQAQIAFSTMLGSGQKAQVFLKELEAFAARTPFEFPDLIRTTQSLMAMGFSAKNVIPMLTSLGDAAAALGVGPEIMNRMVMQLGQIQAQGKVASEEMRVLAQTGIPVWDLLAQKMGTSVAEAMAKVEKGTVSASTGINAIVEGMNLRFAGMMEKQSTTFNGLMSTFKDLSRSVLSAVLEPAFAKLRESLMYVVDSMQLAIGIVSKWDSGTKIAIVGVAGLAAATGPLLLVLGTLAGSFGNILLLVPKISAALKAISLGTTLAVVGWGALLLAVIAFRKEIAMVLLAALATVVNVLERFISVVSRVASIVGREGLANKLADAKFRLEEFRRGLEDSNAAAMEQNMTLSKTQGVLNAEEAARQKATGAINKNKLELEEITITSDEYKKALEELLKSSDKQFMEFKLLSDAVTYYQEAGKSAAEITGVFGSTLDSAREQADQMGVALPPILVAFQTWNEARKTGMQLDKEIAEAVEQGDAALAEEKIALINAESMWQQYILTLSQLPSTEESVRDAQLATNAAMAERIHQSKALIEFTERLLQLEQTNPFRGMPLQGGLSPDLSILNQPITVGGPPIGEVDLETWRRWGKEGETYIERLTSDIARMFTDGIIHGKNFWEAFKSIGTNALASLTTQFFSTLVHGFLDPWKEKFGKWMDEFSIWIKNNLRSAVSGIALIGAGAGIGGALGGTRGAIAGGLAGASLTLLAAGGPYGAAVAGVAALGVALSGLFGNLRKQADKFRESIQDPMTTAVGNLFKSLEASRESGTLTVTQVSTARDAIQKMWDSFQEQATKSGIVGQQALGTMGPFVDQWMNWIDSLEATAKSMEHSAAVAKAMDKVLGDADGWEILEEAIQNLMNTGMDWTPILELMGNDVTKTAHAMHLLGKTVPPAMQAILDQIGAQDRLRKAQERLKEVEKELADTRDRIADALIRKMDFLDREISQSGDKIDQWRDQIKQINLDITDASKKLQDAKFWQEMYTSSIHDAQNEFERTTKERQDIEQQINRLTIDLRREELQQYLEWARASEDAVLIAEAESDLKVFENEQRQREHIERLNELQRLQEELPKVIEQQKLAKDAFDAAKIAAEAEIAAKQQELKNFIDSKKAERDQLEANIQKEAERIEVLKKDLQATQATLDILGVKRQGELEAINASINSLIARGMQLEGERQSLIAITGQAAQTSDIFSQLGGAFTLAADAAIAAIQKLGSSVTPVKPPPPPAGGGSDYVPPVVIGTVGGPGGFPVFNPTALGPSQTGLFQVTPFGVRPISVTDASAAIPGTVVVGTGTPFGGGTVFSPWTGGSFQHGTDFVPRDMLAFVHRGERITPANENHRGGSVTYNPNITISVKSEGSFDEGIMLRTVRDQVIPELMEALDIDASRFRSRLTSLVDKPSSRRLINK